MNIALNIPALIAIAGICLTIIIVVDIITDRKQ